MRTTVAFLGGWLLWTTAGCGGTHRPAQNVEPSGPMNATPAAEDAPAPAGAHASPSMEKEGVEAEDESASSADTDESPTPPPRSAPSPEPTTAAQASRPHETRTAPREPDPRERPGLATAWGETRASHVDDVTFFRVAPDHPFAAAQLFYNDRAGVDALEAYHGGAEREPLDVAVAGGRITIYIVDKERDEPLDAERVGDRTYVVGEEGHRYGIVIANRSERRVEAVATVDGLDVLSGRTGGYYNRGYVVSPWATLEIDGFRRNHEEVAAFRFSSVGESYAGRRGEARNVGVIGVALFGERGDRWSREELRMRDRATPFPDESRFAQPPM